MTDSRTTVRVYDTQYQTINQRLKVGLSKC